MRGRVNVTSAEGKENEKSSSPSGPTEGQQRKKKTEGKCWPTLRGKTCHKKNRGRQSMGVKLWTKSGVNAI